MGITYWGLTMPKVSTICRVTQAALPFLFAAAASVHVQARDLCADLTLIQNAKPGFADLRGVPTSNDNWRANPGNLGNMGDCRVSYTQNAAHVTCSSAFIKDEQAANAKKSEVLKAVGACLGAEWSSQESKLGDAITGTTFNSVKPEAPVAFSVALFRAPSTPPEWAIWFSAVMTSSQEAPRPSRKTPTDPVEFGWRTAGNTLCNDLMTAVAGAKDKFESMKGRKMQSYWLPKSAIAGLSECRIHTGALNYFSCAATTGDSEDESAQVFKALAADVQACLPKPWTVFKRRRKDGLPEVEFSNPIDPGTISVRIRESDGDYSVKLDVDAE